MRSLGLASSPRNRKMAKRTPLQLRTKEHSPLPVPPGVETPASPATPPELQSPGPDDENGIPGGAFPHNRPTSWVEVEGETMEDLQRELEVVTCPKPCISTETQTDDPPEEVPEDCADRWFSGFVDAVPARSSHPAKVTTDLNAEAASSSDSDSDSSDNDEVTCKPERQIRRRSAGSLSRDRGDGPQEPEAKNATAEPESSSSSSSSSSSRALFRIHQKTLLAEPLRKLRVQSERILPAIVTIQVLLLAALHSSYVGQASCLPEVLQRAGLWNDTASRPYLPEDTLLYLTITLGDGVTGLTIVEAGSHRSANRSSSNHLRLEDASDVFGTYRFALDREIVQMHKPVFEKHNFEVRNVSLAQACLAPLTPLADALHFFNAWDGLVINELAYSLRSRGYLERMDGDEVLEAWAWTKEQVESPNPEQGRSWLASLFRKLLILLGSLLSFALISAVTGLFIRIAVHGSAVLMFPLALVAQTMGLSSSRMSINVLSRSFPWIGVHVDVLRRGGRPVWPLLRSHMAFLLVQSFAYLSCNLAWRFLLYRKSSPEGFEENIFSLCSLLELFNLIFVRSPSSAALYPKVASACVVYLHFYIFCSLYPFHGLAFLTCVGACAYVMVYCLNHFEEPALRADPFSNTTPTVAHPRALYLPLLSPSWTIEAAPLWTMFYPPEHASTFPEVALASGNELLLQTRKQQRPKVQLLPARCQWIRAVALFRTTPTFSDLTDCVGSEMRKAWGN
ncbi:unnamed protein product [Symbiodinium sp. CCMP2592]|nr:unnamed protein product [Symbiodinium sp. CCMP2592]